MGLTITEWLQIIGAAIALLTFGKSLDEYIKQGTAKRAEQFLDMRNKLRGNQDFVRICNLLEKDDPQLRDTPLIEKDNFLAFYEDLILLWNSGIFGDHVVFYSFGYYALACWRSKNFWNGLNKNQQTWAYFREFVNRMEQLEKDFKPSRRKYKL